MLTVGRISMTVNRSGSDRVTLIWRSSLSPDEDNITNFVPKMLTLDSLTLQVRFWGENMGKR